VKDYKYHLSVHNCRAIKSAEIDLSEITVLTGVNASGKSTIARMLRDLVEFSAEYERLLSVQMWNARMDMWRYALYTGMRTRIESVLQLRRRNIPELIAKGRLSLAESISMLDKAVQEMLQGNDNSHEESLWIQRIKRLLDLGNDVDIYETFRDEVDKTLSKFDKRRMQRSYVAYRDLMRGNPLMEGSVSLKEGGHVVFSSESTRDTLDEISFIKRAIYIESPFKSIPRLVTEGELDMGDTFSRIKEDIASSNMNRMVELREILSGAVDYENIFGESDSAAASAFWGRSSRWMYHRSDGNQFDLDECATGIKSLAILDILHSKGWLDAETMLIIDEPEAHLHPQWIVEYARMLLLLSKRLKVRIVITSHSPDMINAIHTIGSALDMGEDIGFYLAEKDHEDPFMFNYRKLGNKVGDIFQTYNVSFDRIDAYARNALSK
jgi:predicted ATPase